MTIALAIEYIPRRMDALGIGTHYFLLFRHLTLKPEQKKEIDAQSQFFILLDEVADVRIQSEFGIYDLADPLLSEHDYEHQGKISIWNYSAEIKHIRFIQIIPKN